MSVLRLVRLFETRGVPRDIPSTMVVTGRVDVRSLIEMYDAWSPLAEDLPLAEIRPPQPSTRQSNVPAPTESPHQPTAMAPETEVTKVTAVPFVLAVKTLQQPKDQAVTPTLKPVPTAIRIPTATRIVAATLQPTQASPIVARQHPTARPHGLKAATSRLFCYENDPKYLKRRAEAKLRRAAAAVKSSSPSWGL